MIISVIAALDERNGIGRDGTLPWHLSDDLKNFRRLTMGHHLIMGRRTFESIGHYLDGRILIVLSRDQNYGADGANVTQSLNGALDIARKAGEDEVFVIGGAEVFSQALPISDRFYLTRVHTETTVDTYFPEFDESEWEEKEMFHYEKGPKNDYSFDIKYLEKRQEEGRRD